jgi:hypothetical protein
MDIFDESLLNFWELLKREQVRYIMVGGVAVNLHGYMRVTEDVDVWIDDIVDNRIAFGKVLSHLGYTGVDMVNMQIIPGWTDFQIGSSIELDILVSMKGIEGYSFSECLDMAFVAEIASLNIPFLHINQLIANKKAVNRPKDQLDIIELEKIRNTLENEQNNADS